MPGLLEILQNAVATFDKFTAIEGSPGRLSGDDPSTVVLLHLPDVDQQLSRLARIRLADAPNVEWANRMARAVAQARERSRGLRGDEASEHERGALHAAILELGKLITDQYPGLPRS
jgi:hypothetical protein